MENCQPIKRLRDKKKNILLKQILEDVCENVSSIRLQADELHWRGIFVKVVVEFCFHLNEKVSRITEKLITRYIMEFAKQKKEKCSNILQG
jgi:hypothetical protein